MCEKRVVVFKNKSNYSNLQVNYCNLSEPQTNDQLFTHFSKVFEKEGNGFNSFIKIK